MHVQKLKANLEKLQRRHFVAARAGEVGHFWPPSVSSKAVDRAYSKWMKARAATGDAWALSLGY